MDRQVSKFISRRIIAAKFVAATLIRFALIGFALIGFALIGGGFAIEASGDEPNQVPQSIVPPVQVPPVQVPPVQAPLMAVPTAVKSATVPPDQSLLDAPSVDDWANRSSKQSDVQDIAIQSDATNAADLLDVANRLSDPRFLVRSDAARQLRLADKQAVAPVVKAIDGGDLETLLQGLRILRNVATTHPPQDDGGAYEALLEMSNRIGVTASQTAMAMTEVRKVRSSMALETLGRVGAYFGPGQVTILSVSQQLNVLYLDGDFEAVPENLQWLRWLDGVENVVLHGDAINPPIAASLAEIRNLKRLFLTEGTIDRDTLTSLVSIKPLDALEVHYVEIDPADIDVLAAIAVTGSITLNGTGLPEHSHQSMLAANAGVQFEFKQGGFLGVMCSDRGACVVSNVVDGSGANDAGLMPGDEITRVNGSVVRRFDDLKNEIAKHPVLAVVDVEFRRRDELVKTKMTLRKHEGYRIVVPDRDER